MRIKLLNQFLLEKKQLIIDKNKKNNAYIHNLLVQLVFKSLTLKF